MSTKFGTLVARAAAAAGGKGRTDPKLKAAFEWKNIDFS